MNLLKHKNLIMEKLKECPKASVCSLYIDYAKCFQEPDHVIMMRKLRKCLVSGHWYGEAVSSRLIQSEYIADGARKSCGAER